MLPNVTGLSIALLRLRAGHAFALAQIVELLGVLVAGAGSLPGPRSDAVEMQVQVRHPGADLLLVAQQDRVRDLLVQQDLAGAQDLALLAFGEDDALGLPSGPC